MGDTSGLASSTEGGPRGDRPSTDVGEVPRMSGLSPAIPPSPGRRCSLASRPDAHALRPRRAAKRGKATGMPGSGSDAPPGPRSRCPPPAPSRSPPLARAAPPRPQASPPHALPVASGASSVHRSGPRADATEYALSAEGAAARRGGLARRYRAPPRPGRGRAGPGGQAGPYPWARTPVATMAATATAGAAAGPAMAVASSAPGRPASHPGPARAPGAPPGAGPGTGGDTCEGGRRHVLGGRAMQWRTGRGGPGGRASPCLQ